MKTFEFIEKNLDIVRTLIRTGVVPSSYINYYNIYCVYRNSGNLNSRMARYNFTADVAKTSTLTVMKAVKAMETVVPKS